MIKVFLFGIQLILTLIVVSSSEHICDSQNYIYKQPGDVIITGLLGLHSGSNCSMVETKGLDIAHSLISAVQAVRINNLMPGVRIGLSIYDTCSQQEMAQKALVSALVEAECSESFVAASMMTVETEAQIWNLSSNLGLSMSNLGGRETAHPGAAEVAQILTELHWTVVDHLIATNGHLLEEFLTEASRHRICLRSLTPSAHITRIQRGSTVVIIMRSEEIHQLLPHLVESTVLCVPLDGKYYQISETKSSKVLVVLPTRFESHALRDFFNETTDEAEQKNKIRDLTKSRSSILQVETMSEMRNLVGSLKAHLQTYCPVTNNWRVCPNIPKISYKHQNQNTLDIHSIRVNLKALNIDVDDFESVVVIEQKNRGNLQKIGSIRILNGKWIFDIDLNLTDQVKLCPKKLTNDSSALDCSTCLNHNLLYMDIEDNSESASILSAMKLRSEAWVAALLSISTVGVLCCLAITVFIIVRICKKDILEGNPGFSFLLLFSIIFMYIALLPFSFEIVDDQYKGIFCGFRIFGTSLSYSLVFSVMLSRSLMLASADDDGGFMSHINGYLQTVLCFFIAIVQIALTVQFWTINWFLLSKEQCNSLSRGPLFLLLLGYDMFLLILMLCVSPFILNSKRNYREGAFFAVSSGLCLAVWVSWCAGYMLLPGWEDVLVCGGLVATATSILVVVFIPRTYLMLTGIVRDHLVSTLPSLGHTTSTSVVDVNYRSTQALYDSVTIPRGSSNPNYYTDRPNTPSTSKLEDDRPQENPYERYSPSPTPHPHNITRF